MNPETPIIHDEEVFRRLESLPKISPPRRETTVALIPTIDGKVEWLLAQGMLASTHLIGGVITLPNCSDIAYARNRLLNQFLMTGMEWAVLIDADTGFTVTDLEYLLQGDDYAVNGVYSKKDATGTVVTQGLGFARVHRCLLEALIQIPDLCVPFSRQGEQLHGFCFSGPTGVNGVYLGEDQAFWMLISQLGVKPRIETRLALRHVGRAEYVLTPTGEVPMPTFVTRKITDTIDED